MSPVVVPFSAGRGRSRGAAWKLAREVAFVVVFSKQFLDIRRRI